MKRLLTYCLISACISMQASSMDTRDLYNNHINAVTNSKDSPSWVRNKRISNEISAESSIESLCEIINTIKTRESIRNLPIWNTIESNKISFDKAELNWILAALSLDLMKNAIENNIPININSILKQAASNVCFFIKDCTIEDSLRDVKLYLEGFQIEKLMPKIFQPTSSYHISAGDPFSENQIAHCNTFAEFKSNLSKFLAKGYNLHTNNENRENLLHYVLRQSYFENDNDLLQVLDFLIKEGVNINQRNFNGETPIFFTDNDAALDFLLKNGANINIKNYNGFNIFHKKFNANDGYFMRTSMIAQNPSSFNTAIMLINKGLDIDDTDPYGNTILHILQGIGFIHKTPEALQLINLLIEKGANINKQNIYKETPAHLAVREYFKNDNDSIDDIIDSIDDIINILRKHGADMNIPNIYGITPLNMKEEMRNYFSQTDTEKLSNNIFNAIQSGDSKNFEKLFNKYRLFDYRSFINLRKMFKLAMSEYSKKIHPESNIKKIITRLVSAGANIDTETFNGFSYLEKFLSDFDMVKILIEEGRVNPNIESKNGGNLLHNSSDADVINLLTKKGAYINKRNNLGQTPIFYTEPSVFLEYGALADIADYEGRTPLFYFNSKEDLSILLANGANINHLDKKSITPFQRYLFRNSTSKDMDIINTFKLNNASINNQEFNNNPLLFAIKNRYTPVMLNTIWGAFGKNHNWLNLEKESLLRYAIRNAPSFINSIIAIGAIPTPEDEVEIKKIENNKKKARKGLPQ